jgi:predicted acyltransferase
METSKRIISVDIFRGMTVALMILVNNPGTWGAIYAPFRHAEWHGWTPTDLVFPFFLFIVGTSIVLAYHSKKENNNLDGAKNKIIIRGLKLIGLGLFLAGFKYTFPFFKSIFHLRFPGVLQRIGVVFIITAFLYLKFSWKTLIKVLIIILVSYWLMMMFIPINGGMPLLTKDSNLAALIDLKIFGKAHIWKSNYDPEGLLSTLPAVGTAIMGIFLGLILKMKNIKKEKKFFHILYIGMVSTAIGYFWGNYYPINKALWTSSYVLFSGGLAYLTYAAIYFVMEIAEIKNWGKAFIYYGSNAITIFFLSGFIAKSFYIIKLNNSQSIHSFLYKTLFTSWIDLPRLSSLAYAFSVIFFYYLLARYLYKKNIIIKV